MQTFLPYKDFVKTAKCLDYRRLGKQRVEAYQIINCLENKSSIGWKNHPAVKMWLGYTDALKLYHDCMVIEWVKRGYNNSMKLYEIKNVILPKWIEDNRLHSSHRAKLLGKDYNYYSKFGWSEDPQESYVSYFWPILEK